MTKYADPLLRPAGAFDPHPAYPVEPGKIVRDLDALTRLLAEQRVVAIDGYVGVLWDELRAALDERFAEQGVHVTWFDVGEALLPDAAIEEYVEPFLGGDDPVFGTRCPGRLEDLFHAEKLAAMRPAKNGVSILYGCGAALAGWDAYLAYIDLPKDTIQHRAKARVITNLGRAAPEDAKAVYKRLYFVDWPLLNRHKQELVSRLDLMLDGQEARDPSFMTGDDLRAALDRMGRSYFRTRPWFTPGPWGGHWLEEIVPGLPEDAPNYAWSFEMIAPEAGLTLASGEERLEVSFDTLMFHDAKGVLGEHETRFGTDFPIRFDYLDTMGGGNLSLQVHPAPAYIRERFGEPFTQDETYYLVDCAPDAKVYLGFQSGVDPSEFRRELEASARDGSPVDVERYVCTVNAERHGFYLIPHGTVHCSGTDNMVLEISATPYIFTFKLYDWLRLDLEGRPRPLNIERGFDNLDFSRQGEVVERELISRPRVIGEGDGWRLVHLPTHQHHFYDVHRVELSGRVEQITGGSAHVLNVVEGGPVRLKTPGGEAVFNFAETFVVPASTGRYELVNEGQVAAKVVKAFLKPSSGATDAADIGNGTPTRP
ncbi:MAG TPA: class I mannose-6-phosphate isomerase [Trueperaceae bacterium]